MQLYSHHRRKLFLLHWIAASTAGCGCSLALVDAMQNLAIVGVDEGFAVFLFLSMQLFCAAVLCIVQQQILRRAGYPDTPWVVGTAAGIAVTLVSFPLLVVVFGLIFGALAFLNKDIITIHLFALAIGGIVGLVQSFAFRVDRQQRITWSLCNGSVICVVLLINQLHLLSKSSWAEVGMLVGAIYGVITGGCLAWILPANSEVAAELRYFNWLKNRRFVQKINFEFLKSS